MDEDDNRQLDHHAERQQSSTQLFRRDQPVEKDQVYDVEDDEFENRELILPDNDLQSFFLGPFVQEFHGRDQSQVVDDDDFRIPRLQLCQVVF